MKEGEAVMTRKALVLGGGGPVGIAWESGLLAGFAQGGVNLADADVIMGTSAGSFVGAQLAMGADPANLAKPFLAMADAPKAPKPAASPTRADPTRPPPDLTVLMRKMAEAQSGARPAEQVRAEIGAWAIEQAPMSEDAFIQSFGRFLAGLPSDAWPKKGYACTAVDAETGAFRLWDKAAGVGLARAVASSCSVPGVYPPITIDERRYIDGGMRSAVNADMAVGYDLVVVVAIRVAMVGEAAERARQALDAELKVLTDEGARVELVTPDDASVAAFGPNLMDMRRRPGAAQAGVAQGRAGAEAIRSAWAV
jgi:NTE family protein